MKISAALFLFSSLILISGCTGIEVKPNDPVSIPLAKPDVVPVIISTKAPITTTKEPTTEATTTTSSTTPSTTSTEAPTPPPSTTTSAPVPTTTNAPIPTTPLPDPQKGSWNITGKDGLIMAEMAVQIVVKYNGTNNKSLTAAIDLPTGDKTQVEGVFEPLAESMKLSWMSNGKEKNYLMLNFLKDNKTKTYSLSSVEVSIAPEDLPNIDSNSSVKLVHKHEHFNTSLDYSYRCIKLQNFNLTSDDNKTVGHMKVTNLHFQAFKADKKDNFSVAEDCAFDTPDAVPIAVGCILAGLVVIILVGYLITRRRSQARGYLSM